MSLMSTSGDSSASASRAASPLCAKRAANPSPANTSHSSSHVTRSSSTIMIRGCSDDIADDLLLRRDLRTHRQNQAKGRTLRLPGDELDLPAVRDGDLARDGKPEAAPCFFCRPHRREQVFERVRLDTDAAVAEHDLC